GSSRVNSPKQAVDAPAKSARVASMAMRLGMPLQSHVTDLGASGFTADGVRALPDAAAKREPRDRRPARAAASSRRPRRRAARGGASARETALSRTAPAASGSSAPAEAHGMHLPRSQEAVALDASPRRASDALAYEPALDGLRGACVLAVLLFHSGFTWASGGFLGVSTFCTLSGFLITTLLVAERDASGRLSLRRFWERRVRRLLPAALLTVAAVVVS